jgi:hypothetical protein
MVDVTDPRKNAAAGDERVTVMVSESNGYGVRE